MSRAGCGFLGGPRRHFNGPWGEAVPQGLKPRQFLRPYGTTKVVPFPIPRISVLVRLVASCPSRFRSDFSFSAASNVVLFPIPIEF